MEVTLLSCLSVRVLYEHSTSTVLAHSPYLPLLYSHTVVQWYTRTLAHPLLRTCSVATFT